MDYSHIITVEIGKMGGKPCVRGHRFTVFDVADYLAAGYSVERLISEFPFLTDEDVRASLAYLSDRNKRIVRAA